MACSRDFRRANRGSNHAHHRQPETASEEQKRAFISAERYSAAEMAVLADQEAFHQRRIEIRGGFEYNT